MNTQILPRPVYSNDQHMATLRCPQCGRTKAAAVVSSFWRGIRKRAPIWHVIGRRSKRPGEAEREGATTS